MRTQENLSDAHHGPDCVNCFDIPKSPFNPSTPMNPTLFFNDGIRTIDFVLVWKNKTDDQSQQEIKRKVFEDNLLNEGLDIERETFEDLHFVKVSSTTSRIDGDI